VLNLSGWYDEAYGPEGAVTNFNGLLAARAGDRNPRTHLVLGPWTHGVGATGERRIGELDFGAQAAIDYDDVVLDFFDRYLRGIANDYATTERVRHFVMGANEWRSATQWPPAGVRTVPLNLAVSAEGNGVLQLEPPASASTSSFVADPRDPVVDPYDDAGPHDYRVIAARKDVLSFDTEPLAVELTVSGPVTAVIHVSCDCRDFDLWVRLQDVYPDGRAINLMYPGNDVHRASYRQASRGRQPLEPGAVYELRMPALMTSVRFARGHRIRAQLSASFAPHMSRNLQTGESETRSAESRPARITIHHGGGASRLLLPVTDGTPRAAGDERYFPASTASPGCGAALPLSRKAASRMPTSYSRYMGTAIAVCEIASGGVRKAATTKIPSST
jgi:putative CocE/NonD family hydrolase